MRRYYLSPLEATTDWRGTLWVPRVRRYIGNVATVMPPFVDGQPAFPWCFVIAAAQSHVVAIADAALSALPDIQGLDIKWSSVRKQERDRLLARLTQLGVDTSSLNAESAYRDLVRLIGQHLEPTFSEDAFDTSE